MSSDSTIPDPDRRTKRVAVIGGGPAGLTAAYRLLAAGIHPIVLESGARVGGLSRTEHYRGYRIDIGGHRFFTKVAEVEALWRDVLGSEFLTRPRLSRIFYAGKLFAYPLRLFDALSKLGPIESIWILASYMRSRLLPYRREDTFEEWVSNRFGRRLFRIFFKSYTEKVWGIPCSQINSAWAAQRIQSLSLPRAVLNAIVGAGGGQTIKSLIESFQYPRLGPGMLWERMADIIRDGGGELRLNSPVIRILHHDGEVEAVVVLSGGEEVIIPIDAVISSMPISALVAAMVPAAPAAVRAAAGALTYRDFLTVALIVDRDDLFPDNWIYIHAPEVQVGRIQNFGNWSPDMIAVAGTSCLGLEYFCQEGDSLWRRDDAELIAMAKAELATLGLVEASEIKDGVVIREPKAYPVYTGAYEAHLAAIRAYLGTFRNLQTVGRNGMHMYNNQDHAMVTAMLAVKNVLGEHHDLWSVNVDRAYHEEMRVPSKDQLADRVSATPT